MLKSSALASTGGRKGVAFAADGKNPGATGGHMPETPVKPEKPGVRAQVAALSPEPRAQLRPILRRIACHLHGQRQRSRVLFTASVPSFLLECRQRRALHSPNLDAVWGGDHVEPPRRKCVPVPSAAGWELGTVYLHQEALRERGGGCEVCVPCT
jgi:hypothetical protein